METSETQLVWVTAVYSGDYNLVRIGGYIYEDIVKNTILPLQIGSRL